MRSGRFKRRDEVRKRWQAGGGEREKVRCLFFCISVPVNLSFFVERIWEQARRLRKLFKQVSVQKESGQTGEELLPWLFFGGEADYEGRTNEGEGRVCRSSSLVFIPAPFSHGEEGFLPLFSLDRRCRAVHA